VGMCVGVFYIYPSHADPYKSSSYVQRDSETPQSFLLLSIEGVYRLVPHSRSILLLVVASAPAPLAVKDETS